ncbi:MAG: ArnT family glycosyltransferase [Gemmatimonadaceae bacterium]
MTAVATDGVLGRLNAQSPSAPLRPVGFRRYRVPMVLAALALTFYLPGFWWGAPHATSYDHARSWGVDDETPLGPLSQVHNIVQPKAFQNLGYPLMSSFVYAAAYAPYLAYLRVTGGLGRLSGEYPFGLKDPVSALRTLSLIAHLVSVLMGTIIVVAAFDAGRVLWDRRAGVLAALFMMTSFPMFYYARTGNVDVPVLCFTALALAAFARSVALGISVRRAAWLGAFVGFALATKEPAFASFLAVPVVLIVLQARRTHGWKSAEFWKAPLVALGSTILAFGAGSGLFVDPERYFAHIEFGRSRLNAARAGSIAAYHAFPRTVDGHLELASAIWQHLVDAMTLPGVLLALAGVLLAIWRHPLSATLALSALTYLLILFWSARMTQLRYVMPAVFPLALFAGFAATYALRSRRVILRVAGAALAIGAIGIGAMRGLDLTHAMIADSRYEAGAWLKSRAQPGDRIEFFGPEQKLPPVEGGVITARAIPYRGLSNPIPGGPAAVAEIRRGWRERAPEFVIIMPDHTGPYDSPHGAACPPEIYSDLLSGAAGYRLAAYFETPRLFSWLRRPELDYPTVNPPIRIFQREQGEHRG